MHGKRLGWIGCAGVLAMACGPSDARETPDARSPGTEVLDTAIERMGGLEALRDIERVRYDMVTQWSGLNYAEDPYGARTSYEAHTDVRDYTIDAWRNTREFRPGGPQVVDVVRGDVAIRSFGEEFQPLNIAYVDERRELFAYTPDRLVLGLHDAPDLQALSDTSIAGIRHARVRGTVSGLLMTLHLRRSTGLPGMVSFRAAQPNDFGLVPWGLMKVEVWYSGWRTLRSGLSLPTQWAIERLDQLYKRITVRDVTVNPTFEADSFAVSDELVESYRKTATKPMHDLPLDSARVAGDFAIFGSFGSPAGAVRVGHDWLLLEAGQAPLSTNRALDWLGAHAEGRVLGAVVTTTTGNGGVAALVDRGIPIFTGPGLGDHVAMMLRNQDRASGGYDVVRDARWIRSDTDSVLVAPIDLPDHPGGLVVYAPMLRWMYAYEATQPLGRAILSDFAAARGWEVETLGTGRAVEQPLD
jgi:hypothetical protein